MINIESIVQEIDKKIAYLESLQYTEHKVYNSKMIMMPVNEVTDFYKLEAQTFKIEPKYHRKVVSTDGPASVIEVKSDDEELLRDVDETNLPAYSDESDNENKFEQPKDNSNVKNMQQEVNETIGKRKRVKNSRYNEEEYLLKNSSREFTNAIRGKIGKFSKDPDDSMEGRGSIKSEKIFTDGDDSATEKKPQLSKHNKIMRLKVESFDRKPILHAYPLQNRQRLTFPYSRILSSPKKKHSQFYCKICNKSFSKGYSLTRHMFLHTGQRPHVCYICDYKFIQRSDLERHLTVHQEVPQFPCSHCHSRFRTKKSLKNHIILHNDATPFQCPCGKKFRSNKTLRIHHLMSHTDITYVCDLCGRFYSLKDYLKSHMKTHKIGGNNFTPRNKEEYVLHCDEKIKRLRSMLA